MTNKVTRSIARFGACAFLASALLGLSAERVLADGTETLGEPSIPIAEGTGVVAAGVGLAADDQGVITLDVPGTVRQALLYWSGEMIEPDGIGPDTINVDGIPVVGDLIGGPSAFFANDWGFTTYRADITNIGLVAGGLNTLSVELSPGYTRRSNGAGLLVIYDDGTGAASIDVRDGLDLAFLPVSEPQKSAVPQTFMFPASDTARVAQLDLFFGSVATNRPNQVVYTVGGVTTELNNILVDADGPQWDTRELAIEIPAGATSLTVEAISADPLDTGFLPASLSWVTAALSVPPPAPNCGDGMVDPDLGETCDPPGSTPDTPPGNMNECRDTCTYCGDGIVNNGEECDDPNDPRCSDDCMIIPPFCGDGIVDMGETCDPPGSVPDTPPGNENVCRDSCTYCGDGIVDIGEECDDPNDPLCSNECKLLPSCGDGMVDPDMGETCDPPGSVPNTPPGNMNACRDTCTYCGDGIVNDGEECDDPNDPRCSDDCMIIPPFCGDGIVDMGETCDPPGSVPDTPPGNENVCRDSCTYCGDGIVDNGEECDDPNDPACTDTCELRVCGDGIVDEDLGETCDPPGSVPDDGFPNNLCRDTCTYCGDGIVNNGEDCDFNDPDAPPSCTNTCELVCGLEVAKTCALPPPPAAPEGKCAGKLQEYTVIWNGAGPIDISVGDGLTGLMTSTSSGMQATVEPDDEVTFFTDGSTNDTIVIISGLGTSTFHVSCSDGDMDGDTTTNDDQEQVSAFGRDCGKDQGDGKGDSGVNTWLLEGFVDDDGAVLDCTTGNGAGDTVCAFNAIPADCDNPDKPENLTFLYSGGGCAASDNDQDSGDLFCDELGGGVDPNLAVMITDDDGNVFEVAPGGVFTTARSDSKTFTLVNAGGTEENGRHVSCSQPLQAGDVYGSLTLVGLDGLGIGTPVTYSYEVTNGGDTEVTGIMVTDDQLGPIGDDRIAGTGR